MQVHRENRAGVIVLLILAAVTAVEFFLLAYSTNARQMEVWLGAGILALAVAGVWLSSRVQKNEKNDARMLLDVTPAAAFLVDQKKLVFIDCNAAAEKLLGCPRAEIATQPVGAFFDALGESSKSFLESMRSGVEEPAEKAVTLVDAKQTPVEVQASTREISIAGRSGFLLVITNSSEIEKAQEALHYHATFDEMTGLVNRRTGLLLLEKEMARSLRDGTPLVVAFVDLDGLRLVNEERGSAEGDWMITRAAEILGESVRLGDEAIRLGGDEFLLVLHNCSEEGAQILLRRIEEQMQQVTESDEKPFPLAASMGLAIYDKNRHGQVHQLIAEADRRMYLKKQTKKNLTLV